MGFKDYLKEMTLIGKALDALEKGKEDLAWKIAQGDKDLNDDVTKEKWVVWAKKAIKRRDEDKELAKSYSKLSTESMDIFNEGKTTDAYQAVNGQLFRSEKEAKEFYGSRFKNALKSNLLFKVKIDKDGNVMEGAVIESRFNEGKSTKNVTLKDYANEIATQTGTRKNAVEEWLQKHYPDTTDIVSKVLPKFKIKLQGRMDIVTAILNERPLK